ncbi:uncharacterized protein LOC143034241 [Oratosquilla oratoria]|uniref:uncharacterized protein LOC143034241 n=1 Tax=Oratosquilla oratoria TaxID=337810 RepID=UPI003F766F03
MVSAQDKMGTAQGPERTRALSLQASGEPTSASYARLGTSFPVLSSFSVCYRIKTFRYREESTLMSYAVSDSKDNELRMDHRVTGVKISFHSKWAKTTIQTPLDDWSHFCFTMHVESGNWTIYKNGVREAQGNLPPAMGPLEGEGAYIIGQEQDAMGGGFQRDQSYSGEITDLNFWRYILDDATIKKVMNGRLAVPTTLKENDWLYNSTKEMATACSGGVGASYMWLGADDMDKERTWVYIESREPLRWEGPWRGAGPNGGTAENCLVMLHGDNPGRWSDIACLESYNFCVPCEYEGYSSMYLKGKTLCSTSPFNNEYRLIGVKGNKPMLKGTLHSDIYWSEKDGTWVLSSLKTPDVSLHWKPKSTGEYPFGTKEWTLDAKTCGINAGTKVNMTLSVCAEGEFTCSDGTCIDLLSRCNLKMDCPDQSDEMGCSVVNVPQGYRPTIPPPSPIGGSLPVNFSIDVASFPSIIAQEQTFTISLKLNLNWQDIRLSFRNLKTQRSLNLLSPEAVGQVWTPVVFFSNAKGNIFTDLEQGSRVECVQQGRGYPSTMEYEEEMFVYPGSENSLEMSQMYSVTYSCNFDLLMFPFDHQRCSMYFKLLSAPQTYMKFLADSAVFSGVRELIEYTIGDITLHPSQDTEFSVMRVDVSFGRRYGYYVLTLYIPTTLLIIISYCTFYFKLTNFQARIIVAITTLLVLSSLFTQTSSSLPKTSYFKLIDIWLFFAIVIIFCVVIFHTAIEFFDQKKLFHFRRESINSRFFRVHPKNGNGIKRPSINGGTISERSSRSEGVIDSLEESEGLWPLHLRVLLVGRIIIPAMFIIFNIVYWGVAVQAVNSVESSS